MKCGGDILSL